MPGPTAGAAFKAKAGKFATKQGRTSPATGRTYTPTPSGGTRVTRPSGRTTTVAAPSATTTQPARAHRRANRAARLVRTQQRQITKAIRAYEPEAPKVKITTSYKQAQRVLDRPEPRTIVPVKIARQFAAKPKQTARQIATQTITPAKPPKIPKPTLPRLRPVKLTKAQYRRAAQPPPTQRLPAEREAKLTRSEQRGLVKVRRTQRRLERFGLTADSPQEAKERAGVVPEDPAIRGGKEKRAAKALRQAAKKAGKVSNPALGPRQSEFVAELAKQTGLDAAVLAGMAASEQPADSPAIEGSDNWLNIGYYDSGPGAPTQDPRFFAGPKAAARLTADFLKGKELGASEGIQAIMNTAGQSPEAQIAAIQNSGWASSGHPNLPALAAQTTVTKPIPKRLRRAVESTLGEAKAKKIVRGPQGGGEAAAPKQMSGAWGGAQRAVLSVVPKAFRAEGRGDKRTPAENASVGGSSTSDHLTTNEFSYAADLPADDALAQSIAKKLGMASWTGTNEVTKDGYRYQLIWQDAGHYDHVHLGAEWVGSPDSAPGYAGGPVGSGGAVASGSVSASGGVAAPSGGGEKARKRRRGGRKLEGRERSRLIREIIAQEPAQAIATPTRRRKTAKRTVNVDL